MVGPRDPVVVGPDGTPNQTMHAGHIREAVEALRQVMHDAEGSTHPGEHQEHIYSTRRMALAATYLEIAEMMALKATKE